MKKLLIFPFGGNALEALDCIGGQFEVIGFIDDAADKQGGPGFAGVKVLAREALKQHPDAQVLAVPGNAENFRKRSELITSLGIEARRCATVIHPAAHVSKHATIGANTLVMAGVVITSNAVIGSHVCILPNTVIHHDARIGDYTLLGSGVIVAGGAKVGRNSYVGSGVQLISGVSIGDGALVGMGSNVLRDVAPGATVAGNPARFLK